MAHPGPLQRLTRLLRHRWADGRLRRVLTPEVLQRLGQRVAASERRHTGQIRICAEGGLPLAYLWRGASARERAITQFGKLRVWDTEHNNGVLIYLLLTEHAIEIVADRAVARRVDTAQWQAIIASLGGDLRAGQYEEALRKAIAQVSLLLAKDFPRGSHPADNELADAPIVR